MNPNRPRTIVFLFSLFVFFPLSVMAERAYKPCGISLSKVEPMTGSPGQQVKLFGTWGETQGIKKVCFNKGKCHPPKIISWQPDVLVVEVPPTETFGSFKVGVYCNDPFDPKWRGSYSSGWKKFELTAPIGGGSPPAADPSSPPQDVRQNNEEPPAQPVEETGGNMWWWIIGIGLFVFLTLKARKNDTRVSSLSSQASLSTPLPGSTSHQTSHQERYLPDQEEEPRWDGVFQGTSYHVDVYDGETLTVEISLHQALQTPLEINARTQPPPLGPSPFKRDIEELLDLGVNYIDIGFNTQRIAAELPWRKKQLIVNQALVDLLLKHLIRIRDLSS